METAYILMQEVMRARRIKAYVRYRDDILIIAKRWQRQLWRAVETPEGFLANQNKSPCLIEGWVVSTNSIVFLDTDLYKGPRWKTQSKIYSRTHRVMPQWATNVSKNHPVQMETRNTNCLPPKKNSNDASSPARKQWLLAGHQPLDSSDGGEDEDTDTGTDTTVPDADNDGIVSFISQQTIAIDTPNL